MLKALNNIDSVEEGKPLYPYFRQDTFPQTHTHRKRERELTIFDILKLVIVWGYFHQPLRL